MKFTTIATSALACNSIWAGPISQNYQADNSTSVSQDSYNITAPCDIQISKIPKDEFIQKINEGVDKIQKFLDISFDFGQRLDHLSNDQKQQLDAWWTQIAPKYQQPLPKDPNQVKQIILPDLKQFIQIVYQADADQVLDSYKKLLQN
ncbi:hypothetical protein CONCODRAFT_79241 [Conidiobolus coronatus NRRL 28638]|uniref:Uncharacterized protein n=1 Tax=Conidiobolus coronatus (strain ATCC 28846 / CBS 209.66 / NRRL 28638) TaxID=796925 RepID=A0A137P3K4_CONC2|nr:hypothetical protein CONCODRAFT_79241 [Conidiobolus coronatus NRRL 28638]|eukprot:KXN69602.1 hypothetical protein CONCODRAFT_79241 [Conidiobolus coronatus NRRL 28638]